MNKYVDENGAANADGLQAIQEIASTIAPKFVFGYFEADDIEQEAIIAGLEAIHKYDEEKGSIRTFLFTHIHRQMCNLKRNKYYRLDKDNNSSESYRESKKDLVGKSPNPLSDSVVERFFEENVDEQIDAYELFNTIDNNFPIHYRTLWLRFLSGSRLGTKQAETLFVIVSSILERNGFSHELKMNSFIYKKDG